jgi:hypothetical protein
MTGARYVVEGLEPHCTVVDLAQPDKPGPRYRTHADAQAEADRLNTPSPRTPQQAQTALFDVQEVAS